MTAGALLREARRNRGLSQRALAERSGAVQPTISALERGRHDPGVATLERFLGASGARLAVLPTRVRPVADAADAIRGLIAEHQVDDAFRELIQIADDLAAENGAVRVALAVTPPAPVGDRRFDAFLAAVVEHRLSEQDLVLPEWTAEPQRACEEPWFVSELPAYVARARHESPPAFARRGVFLVVDELSSV